MFSIVQYQQLLLEYSRMFLSLRTVLLACLKICDRNLGQNRGQTDRQTERRTDRQDQILSCSATKKYDKTLKELI